MITFLRVRPPEHIIVGLALLALTLAGAVGVARARPAAAGGLPDFVVSITSGGVPVPPNWSVMAGRPFSYTVVVRDHADFVANFANCPNLGSCPVLRTALPAGFQITAIAPSKGLSCSHSGNSILCFAPQVTPSAPVWVTVGVMAPTAPGSYKVLAQADPANWVAETNEANNTMLAPIAVQ